MSNHEQIRWPVSDNDESANGNPFYYELAASLQRPIEWHEPTRDPEGAALIYDEDVYRNPGNTEWNGNLGA